MELLEGVKSRVVRGQGGRGSQIKKALRGMRDGKAMGIDKIPGELWKYGGNK